MELLSYLSIHLSLLIFFFRVEQTQRLVWNELDYKSLRWLFFLKFKVECGLRCGDFNQQYYVDCC